MAGHFLRSALRERFAQLRPIRAISQELRAVFSARQTLWRSRQSGANLSLPKFPANREFNREFLKIVPSKTALSFSNLHILQEKHIFCANPSREFSELYQGIKRTYQGFDRTDQGIWYSLVCDVGRQASCLDRSSENQGLLNPGPPRICRRESQLLSLLDPAQGNMCAQFLKTQITGLTSFEDARRSGVQ